jgi:H+/gluconate symporter-like permease
MRHSSISRILRLLVIPAAVVLGLFAGPMFLMPHPADLRRAGPDRGRHRLRLCGIFGFFGGALVGYIVRTILDHSLRRQPKEDDAVPAG